MNLFAEQDQKLRAAVQPLAVRMRPRTLAEFVGQEHFVGPGKLLRRLIESDRLTSAVFYGPPGCGKTTLARLVAETSQAAFETLHAAEATVKDVRGVIERAQQRIAAGKGRTVLFLDEIHRFNKAQQDVLLKDVEEGVLVLIGATTENPFFSVNSPLLSRSNIFQFRPLSATQIRALLEAALADGDRGLGAWRAHVDDDALDYLAQRADGDARRALNGLEIAVRSAAGGAAPDPATAPPHVTLAVAAESLQLKAIRYDGGDAHYDVASAFIKSMRGSDPDAALYWLARMLEGGEDPRFIARRIAICASEDVGTADSRAIVIAAAAVQITEFVGLPECEYALAHATVYVATAPKSNAVTLAIGAAKSAVREDESTPVPIHLRDKHYGGAKRLGHGVGYQYPHDFPDAHVAQEYGAAGRRFYEPSDRGEEARIAERLARWRATNAASDANEAAS